MRLAKAILIICTLLVSLMTLGQSKERVIDSLENVLQQTSNLDTKIEIVQELYNQTLYSDSKKARQYAKEHLALARDISDTIEIAGAQYNIGVLYYNTARYDSANFYFKKAKVSYQRKGQTIEALKVNRLLAIVAYSKSEYKSAEKLIQENISSLKDSSSVLLAISYDLLGQIQSSKGDLDDALEATLTSLKILEDFDEPNREAGAFTHLGEIELKLDNPKKAIPYLQKAYAIYEEKNDLLFQAITSCNLGVAHKMTKDYDKAETILDKAINQAKQMENTNVVAIASVYLGEVYIEQNKYPQAISIFKESVALMKAIGAKNELVGALTSLGDGYFGNNQTNLAIQNYTEAIIISEEIASKEQLYRAYEKRATAYEKDNKFSLALTDFKKHKNINDSIFSSEKSKQIELLRTQFDTETKEKEIELQKSEIELLEQKQKADRLQKILLIGSILGLIILFGFALYSIQQKIKRTRLERAQLNKELAYKNKTLTTHALQLAKKNEVLEDLKSKAKQLKADAVDEGGYQLLIQKINFDQQDDKSWDTFIRYFEEVHKDFNKKAQATYPEITAGDLRLMALLKMNLSSKEIANILNISMDGVKKARQRLRKKLQLSSEDSLEKAVVAI